MKLKIGDLAIWNCKQQSAVDEVVRKEHVQFDITLTIKCRPS
jgi:uncharacterized Tic20 family protein